MKKVLIGLAAGALAVTAMNAPVSAGVPTDSVYDILVAQGSTSELLIDASGLGADLSDCGNTGNNNGLPNYTVFYPASDAIFGSVLTALDLTLGELAAQPALVKAALLNHVVKADISPSQLEDNSNSKFTTMGGLVLTKTWVDGDQDGDVDFNGTAGEMNINGYPVVASGGSVYGQEACNGWVYLIVGFLAPSSADTTQGTTTDGSTVPASGEGLPATGSESMALTYAALASLIAGAGVLVIRRRSVA